MPTSISSSTPYCSAEEFLTRYDWRPIAQLMNDTTTPTATRANLLNTGTDEGARLYRILLDCSGEVEAAVLVGKRYQAADLQALTGASLAYLQRIVADLAIGRCFERRPGPNPWAQQTATARQLLNALASGEALFALQENADASLVQVDQEYAEQIEDRDGMVFQMRGYFGTRGNRRHPY